MLPLSLPDVLRMRSKKQIGACESFIVDSDLKRNNASLPLSDLQNASLINIYYEFFQGTLLVKVRNIENKKKFMLLMSQSTYFKKMELISLVFSLMFIIQLEKAWERGNQTRFRGKPLTFHSGIGHCQDSLISKAVGTLLDF